VLGDAELLTQAMIVHRDGIVGPWMDTYLEIQKDQDDSGSHIEDDGQMWRWDDWVRASVYDFELASNLAFGRSPPDQKDPPDGVTLWHRPFGPTGAAAAPVEIVQMFRPSTASFVKQLAFMDRYSDLREERANETLIQMGPQTAFWASIVNLSPIRTPKTLELLATVIRFSILVEMRFKHALACTRAVDYTPQTQPMIATPGHGSLPSGHSTQAFIIAEVLWAFFHDLVKEVDSTGAKKVAITLRKQLLYQAARVAINRTIAGVHFPADSAAGHLLGTTLGEYFVARCTGGAPAPAPAPASAPPVAAAYAPRVFRGDLFNGDTDFDPNERLDPVYAPAPALTDPYPAHVVVKATVTSVQRSPLLAWMWKQARNEWNGEALKNSRI